MGFENFSCGCLTVAVQQQQQQQPREREREREQTVNGRYTLVLQRRAYMGHAYVQLRALVFGRSLGIAVEDWRWRRRRQMLKTNEARNRKLRTMKAAGRRPQL